VQHGEWGSDAAGAKLVDHCLSLKPDGEEFKCYYFYRFAATVLVKPSKTIT